MRARFAVAAVGVSALSVALVGCTPTPTALPEVVIEHEGSADLDGDETVVALRAAQLAQEMAWNSGDFTLSTLVQTTTPDAIDDLYREYLSFTFRDYEPEVHVGPRIWAPISVASTAEGAELTVCLADQDRSVTKSDPETSYDLSAGLVVTYTVEVDDQGRAALGRVSGTQEACDASAAEVLTFDPAPTPPEKITEGDIRKPAGK